MGGTNRPRPPFNNHRLASLLASFFVVSVANGEAKAGRLARHSCVKSQRSTWEVWPVTVQRRGNYEMANLRGLSSQRNTREVWPVTVQRFPSRQPANLRGDYLREVTA
jgi:hypothetical protein